VSCLSAGKTVDAAVIQRYEQELVERSTRRKIRRGGSWPQTPGISSQSLSQDEVAPTFCGDFSNPCGIDKAQTVLTRRYGGLLVATLPCGRVAGLVPLAGGHVLSLIGYCLLKFNVNHQSV